MKLAKNYASTKGEPCYLYLEEIAICSMFQSDKLLTSFGVLMSAINKPDVCLILIVYIIIIIIIIFLFLQVPRLRLGL